MAVIRGRVSTRDGQPLSGVTVAILGHPELGSTLTRADGMFDLAANGGGALTVTLRKEGFLPAHRAVRAPWRDYVWAAPVTLVPVDAQATKVDLSLSMPQLVRGSEVSDEDGKRRARLLLKPGTQAGLTVNGQSQTLSALTIRATEYTVGESGVSSMPADLPPETGYTYAVEFSADEGLAAGASAVTFSKPVISYVENFLGFPVGTAVPAGYYDREQGIWVAAPNGRVIKVLDVANGKAALDVDGDGNADSGEVLAALGVDDVELAQLAGEYAAGTSLWRVPITHFTPWDCNWPYGPPPDAKPPRNPDPRPRKREPCQSECKGSIIGIQDQTLGERIPITGTPFALVYASDRTRGWRAGTRLKIQASDSSVPASLKRIEVDISVGGQEVLKVLPAAPNQTVDFDWDGKDAYGRQLQGMQPATVEIRYVYPVIYQEPAQLEATFRRLSGVPMSAVKERGEVNLSQRWTGTIGGWDARLWRLGGWMLDQAHLLDGRAQQILFGDGSVAEASPLRSALEGVAGTGTQGFSGDGGPATAAEVSPSEFAVAFGADGSLYLAEPSRIRRVGPDGIIKTVAGGGTTDNPGDGGPAAGASIARAGIALAVSLVDGTVAFTDDLRIRRIRPDGVIEAAVGKADLLGCLMQGAPALSPDGPASDFCSVNATALAFGPDGTLYFFDGNRVRRLGNDGLVSTLAGGGDSLDDGVPATAAGISGDVGGLVVLPNGDVAYLETRTESATSAETTRLRIVGRDGLVQTLATGEAGTGFGRSLLGSLGIDASGAIYATLGGRLHRVRPDGTFEPLVGCAVTAANDDGCTIPSEGLPAYQAALLPAFVAPDGSAYSVGLYEILRISSHLDAYADLMVSPDGQQHLGFDGTGHHTSTLDALTQVRTLALAYDEGALVQMTDLDGLTTRVERDANGQPTAIVSPYGQRTSLEVDSAGSLTAVVDPAGGRVEFTYGPSGLMMSMKDAREGLHSFEYDADGRLTKDTDPAGGFKALKRTEEVGPADKYSVDVTTSLGRTTTHSVETLPAGAKKYSSAEADGTVTTTEVTEFGTTTTRTPEGMVVVTQQGPQVPFGLQAPMVVSMTETTPSGLVRKTEQTREAEVGSSSYFISTLRETAKVNDKSWTRQYDAATRTLITTSPLGRMETVSQDDKGRIVRMEIPGIAPVSIAYDQNGRPATVAQGERQTVVGYDAQGYLSSITDPLSRVVALQSDVIGRLTKQTGPDNGVTEFRYDANSNIVGLTPPGRTEYGFGYTPVDLESSFTPPSVASWNPTTSYFYDKDEAVASIARPDGVGVAMTYDAAGRVSQIDHPRGSVKLGYDAASGKLISAQTADETLAWAYDGSLVTSSALTGTVSGTVGYAYDNDFRLTSTTVNGGSTASLGYDDDGLLTSAGDVTLARDSSNGLLTRTTAGVVAESFGYNAFGEVTSNAAKAGSSALLEIQYTRDALGRISAKDEIVGATTAKFEYGYDAANRLVEVKKDGVMIRGWTYDAAGNRTSATEGGATVSATYDAQDRLVSYGTTTYTFGNAGDLQSRQRAGEAPTQYGYDAVGSLVAATLPDGRQLAYVVDAQGRRVGKKVNGVLTQEFLWESQLRIAAELDGSGDVVSRFVYGTKINVPELIIKGTATYRLVTDQLGSPRLVVNTADGTVAQRVDYDEWGNTINDTNPGFQPFGFAGGLRDRDAGLVRFGARDYEADTGRFIRAEPMFRSPSALVAYAKAGVQLNPYAYAASNPIYYEDLDGLVPSSRTMAKIAAALMRLLGVGEKMVAHEGTLGSPQGAKAIQKAEQGGCAKAPTKGAPPGGRPPPDPNDPKSILEWLDLLDMLIPFPPIIVGPDGLGGNGLGGRNWT